MSNVVLDASALLAMFNSEPGKEMVEEVLSDTIISAVNASEVIAELQKLDITADEARKMIETVVQEVVAFDLEQATNTAALKAEAQQFGLSLGDRACIALGQLKNCPVYTADKIWSKMKGVHITLIR